MAQPGWGVYGFADLGPDLFHPEDQHQKDTMIRHGDVCECIGEEGEYTILRFGDLLRVRVRSRLLGFHPIEPPAFDYGDRLRVKPPRTLRVGQVRRIIWHAKKREPVFI
jgi:hypothetical protein